MFAARSYKNYGASTDPYFNNTSLLLHGDGTNGAQNNTFLDSSPNNFTITRNGTPTQGSFSPFPLNGTIYNPSVHGGSGYFDGGGDYLTIPDNPAFNLGSSNFTAECWVYLNSSVDQYFFGQIQQNASNRSFCLALISSRLYFEVRSGTNPFFIQDSNNVVLNSWIHIAAVRNDNTITLYKNGTSIGTVNVSGVTVNDSTNLIGVGCAGGYVAEPLNGYISNTRLVVGTAVYTSNFTPPTSPVTNISGTSLLCNFSNAGIFDNTAKNNLITVGNAQISTSVKKYGTGSMYFNGSGDYLTAPYSDIFSFGSEKFTIEAWVYANSLDSFNGVIGQWPDNGGSLNNSYILESVGSNMRFYWSSGSIIYGPAILGTITTGAWIHYAICRNGNILYPFKNGILGTTISITQTLNNPSSNITIGGLVAGSGFWNGYIDDLRVTKGVARYTANFTPPQQAFPNL